MNIGELVGKAPYVCGPDTSLSEAAQAMEESDLGSLAVVEGMSLLGLITERDIRRAVAGSVDCTSTSVADVMSAEPDTFDPDLDVWDAAAWITESGYRHLPVVDDDGALLGVVSIRDLLRALVNTV
ncbi:MAG: CBS domain-containing protein [Actinomycetota bacterium]|nr:CBS domain-containing protein [Actinomycetota bacterium]